MANYIFTNKAVENLSKIWDYMLIDSRQEFAEDKLSDKNYREIKKDNLVFTVNNISSFTRNLNPIKLKLQEFFIAEWI